MIESDALWVRVLKGVYFHNEDFLEARKGGRASWMWNSLLVGKEMLKEHALWKIMDGEGVSIWQDNWIPRMNGKRLQHPGLIDSQIPDKVAKLMSDENGEWNLRKVEQWLSEEQCEAIRVIPTCVNGGKDEMV